MSKKIKGWVAIALLAAVDFAMVQSLILESNAVQFVAILGAVLFCVGFEGGPAFLGMGLVELLDKTRTVSGTGKTKSVVYITVGSICTVITFVSYFLIRRDAIAAAGGFDGIRYEGFYGDLILMIVPFITSLTAFGIALWFSTSGADSTIAEAKEAQKEYEDALEARNVALNEYRNVITTVWSRHFPYENMPSEHNEAIDRIRRKVSAELTDRLRILLPHIINETNLVTPFSNSFKEIFRHYVRDSDYLSVVCISNFDTDNPIGAEYELLQNRINNIVDSVVGAVSTRRTGNEKVA